MCNYFSKTKQNKERKKKKSVPKFAQHYFNARIYTTIFIATKANKFHYLTAYMYKVGSAGYQTRQMLKAFSVNVNFETGLNPSSFTISLSSRISNKFDRMTSARKAVRYHRTLHSRSHLKSTGFAAKEILY